MVDFPSATYKCIMHRCTHVECIIYQTSNVVCHMNHSCDISYRIISHHASCHIMYHITCVISCNVISYYVLSYNIIPHHTISLHTIYHSISRTSSCFMMDSHYHYHFFFALSQNVLLLSLFLFSSTTTFAVISLLFSLLSEPLWIRPKWVVVDIRSNSVQTQVVECPMSTWWFLKRGVSPNHSILIVLNIKVSTLGGLLFWDPPHVCM